MSRQTELQNSAPCAAALPLTGCFLFSGEKAGDREQRAETLNKNLDRGGAPEDFARPDYNLARELLAITLDVDWREVEAALCTWLDSVFK